MMGSNVKNTAQTKRKEIKYLIKQKNEGKVLKFFYLNKNKLELLSLSIYDSFIKRKYTGFHREQSEKLEIL